MKVRECHEHQLALHRDKYAVHILLFQGADQWPHGRPRCLGADHMRRLVKRTTNRCCASQKQPEVAHGRPHSNW